MPAKLIDRYVLERVIGTGGFATVWLAHDPVVGVDVALKVLADNWARDPDMRERFVSEARLGLQINSPRIMRVHVVNESADGIPYIVMAFADGGTLRERTRNRALSGVRFSVSEAIDIAREIALGLEELHQAGHLHRDVKPANVLFQSTPRGEQLVLSDFGLARAVDKTAITQIAGSPAYMAPEQAAGVSQLSPAVDLYPLGVILAELLAGVSPTEVSTLTEAADQGSIDVAGFFADHNVAIPAELAELVGDLVALDPQRRPLSAGLAARRLQHIGQKLAGSSVGEIAANPPSFAPRTKVADGPPVVHALPTAEREADVDLVGSDLADNPAPSSISKWAVLLVAAAVAIAVAVIAISAGGNQTVVEGNEVRPTAGQVRETAEVAPTETPIASSPALATEASLPAELPLPPGSVIDQTDSVADLRLTANVALTVQEVTNFYATETSWRVRMQQPGADGSFLLEILPDGIESPVALQLTPAALSSGTDVTKIVARPLAS